MSREQETKPDFILHGMIDLTKSIDSAKDVVHDDTGNRIERRLIWGEITNSSLDEDDERLISKSLDFSYFDDQGWIKYEHVQNDPAHIIGCPHERTTGANGGTLIKGAIFPDGKFSNDVWQLVQNIEAHNRQFPEHQKTLGWSIEGNYTDGKVAKGGFRKAKVINVVITPNPVNKSVYLHALEENHKRFAKSLSYKGDAEKAMTATPTSTDLARKTGVDAIAKENIDDKIKETAEDLDGAAGSKDKKRKSKLKKSTNGSSPMKIFDTEQDAAKHFVEEGHDEETAAKLAKSLFPEDTAGDGAGDAAGDQTEVTSMLKSLSDSFTELKEKLFKSETGGDNGLVIADEIETITDDDGEYFDAAPMLLDIQKSVGDLTNLVNQKVAYDHERDQIMAKALGEVDTMRTDLAAQIEAVRKSVYIGEGDDAIPVATAIEAILKSRPGAPIDLSKLTLAGEGAGDGNAVGGLPQGVPKTFGELKKSLVKGQEANKITLSEMSLAENAYRSREYETVAGILEKATGK